MRALTAAACAARYPVTPSRRLPVAVSPCHPVGRIRRSLLALCLLGLPHSTHAAIVAPTVHEDAQGVYATSPAAGTGMGQYLFDWGDGTQGTGSPVNPGVPGRAPHGWRKPGSYRVRARLIRTAGGISEWSDPCECQVRTAEPEGNPLDSLKVLTSSTAAQADGRNLLDGKGWSSAIQQDERQSEWVIIDLETPRTVNRIALKPMPNGEGFPSAFTVEYCTDDGRNWTAIPIDTFRDYPNPGDQAVLLETGLLCARKIRITATRLSPVPGGYAFKLRKLTLRTAREAPFFTSLGGSFDADVNNMWNIFGLASDEITPKGDAWWDGPGGALAFGSTEWHEWDVLKLCWADLPRDTARLQSYLSDMPVDNDGYVWACDGGPLHLGLQKHFDYSAINILAAHKYFLWTGEPGFFTQPLPDGVRKKCPAGVITLLDKLRKEMSYQLDVLDGKNGLLKIPDPSYDGTPTSKGTTYWDAHPTGYLSAYPNALFYASVAAMADIEGIAGDADRRNFYLHLLPLIKKRFNETFWSQEKGRYISTIDKNGVKYDYGITASNLYAVVYGAAEDAKAAKVMDWLSGKRVVEGDTAQGADIYHWKIAPLANTVAFESIEPHWWAGDFAGVSLKPGGWGRWGINIQNGGAILYISYYDVLARLRVNGPDDAFDRFSKIIEEFHRSSLRPDTPGHYGPPGTPAFGVGVSVSFPESGLVPLAMLYGFLGVEPTSNGLQIHPLLPRQLEYAGVNDVLFHGTHYRITAKRGVTQMSVKETSKDHFEVIAPNGMTGVIAAPR